MNDCLGGCNVENLARIATASEKTILVNLNKTDLHHHSNGDQPFKNEYLS